MRKLRRVAAEQGISVAEVVRRCIDRALDREVVSRRGRYERAARHVGAFRDRGGARRVSEEHDTYLEDAFE